MEQLGKLDQGKEQFSVWGGKLKPNEWHGFLSAWSWPQGETRWRILEFVSDFKIDDGTTAIAAEHIPLLERAELFGKSGHLSTRRDGEWVYWHFIGEPTMVVPAGYEHTESYWEKHAEEKFRRTPMSMLLWGERVKEGDKWADYWFDDRVGWAELKYPHVLPPTATATENQPAASEQKKQRVQANYWQFTRAGQVAFVWLTGLEEYSTEGE